MKDEYDLDKMKRREGKMKILSEEEVKIPTSLRLAPSVISLLRDEADRLGIPYQTLISSILHRFVTGELVDKERHL